jgi:deazaflavin-dependent oxidoreductase (nitroreductase family)
MSASKQPLQFRIANAVMRTLIKAGVPIGDIHLLSVPGRKSGQMRTTPVAVYLLNGQRYLVAESPTLDWVKNVRAAGWATITQRRKTEQVTLVELSPEAGVPILTAAVQQTRGASAILGVARDASPETFSEAAQRLPIFRAEVRK